MVQKLPQVPSDVIEALKVDDSVKAALAKLTIQLKAFEIILAKSVMELESQKADFEADLKKMEDIGDREVPKHYKLIQHYFDRILFDHDQIETAYFDFVKSLGKEEK